MKVRNQLNKIRISREIAERYTDSELREVLLHLRLTPGF